MKMKFLAYIVFFLPLITHSESVCKDCKITGIQADNRRGGTYIWLTGNWSESNSTCSTPSSHAFFVPAGGELENNIISLSMAAMLADKTVGYVYGTGICNQGYELLSHIYVVK